jgi:hypothetical protein
MDPVLMMLIPGVLGGLVVALLLRRLSWHDSRGQAVPPVGEPLSSGAINMAHIRVAGEGGLGLIVIAVASAVFVPRIGQTIGLGFVLGAVLAVALVVWRRHGGPLPSSSRHPGAHGDLGLEASIKNGKRR